MNLVGQSEKFPKGPIELKKSKQNFRRMNIKNFEKQEFNEKKNNFFEKNLITIFFFIMHIKNRQSKSLEIEKFSFILKSFIVLFLMSSKKFLANNKKLKKKKEIFFYK